MKRLLFALGLLLLVAACSSKPAVVRDYDHAPVPPVPERTAEVPAGDAALADGQYWAKAVALVGDGAEVQWTISQALFGPSCEAAGGIDCANGYVEVPEPTRTLAVVPPNSITVVAATRQNFGVTTAEWLRLVHGGAPAATAPDGFVYTTYPYLISVVHGAVAEVHQIWVPEP